MGRRHLEGLPVRARAATDRVAKLSVVGVGMRSHAGVAARLFQTMAAERINVRLVSTSEIKISLLVEETQLERAVQALHTAYGLSDKVVKRCESGC